MIFQTLPWFLVAGFFACCGCAVAALVLESRYQRVQRKVERDMTRKLRLRYDAYLVLEQQVKRVVAEFANHETAFKELVGLQREHIDRLRSALSTHDGEVHVVAETPSWMDEPEVEVVSVVDDDAKSDAHPELAALQKKLESNQIDRQAEIEREKKSLGETAMRLARLEPLQDQCRRAEETLAVREQELEASRARCAELERAAGLETTRLQRRVDSLEPLVEELAKARSIVLEWQSKSDELAQHKTLEMSSLHERLNSLQPLVDQATKSETEARTWKEKCESTSRDARTLEHQVDSLRGELANLEGRLAKSQSDCAASVASSRQLGERVEELERANACVHVELEETRAVLEREKVAAVELHGEIQTLTDERRAMVEELEALRKQFAETNALANTRAQDLRRVAEESSEFARTTADRIANLEAQVATKSTELEALTAQCAEARALADSRDEQVRRAGERESELSRATSECVANLESRVAMKASELETLAKQYADACSLAETRADELRRAGERESELARSTSERIANLEREVAAKTAELETLGARAVELDARFAASALELASLVTRHAALERTSNGDIERWKSQCEATARELSVANDHGRELDERCRSLQSELGDLRSKSNENFEMQAHRIATLESELESARKTCASLRGSIEELTDRCEVHAKSLDVRTRDLADRELRLSKVSARVEVLNLEISKAREAQVQRDERIGELERRATAAESENQKHRAMMAAHSQQFETAHSLLAELRPVIENLENELKSEKIANDLIVP